MTTCDEKNRGWNPPKNTLPHVMKRVGRKKSD